MSALTVYLSARYSRREELCGYRSDLVERGHKVPARWLNGEHQVHGVEAAREVEAGGPDDVADVQACDLLISFTEAPRTQASGRSRGGRHVEFGLGLGMRLAGMGPTLVLVGPLENVFHAVPEVDGRFDTWADFLAVFDALPSIHGWDRRGEDRCEDHPLHKWSGMHRRAYAHPFTPRATP